jgi:hypothetical protein
MTVRVAVIYYSATAGDGNARGAMVEVGKS